MTTKLKIAALFVIIALGLLYWFCGQTPLLSAKRKNVILVMIDTLRADHLGVYGYKRNTSPTLDQFAKQNIMAKRAIAVAPWTPPSTASILTGLSVAHHGHNPNLVESKSKKLGQLLRDEVETLPEILKQNGFQTGAASSNPWISKEFNFDQGFDSFFYERRSTTEVTLNGAKKILSNFSDKPFFLYIHILDPHGPRTPSAEYAAMFTGKVEGTWPYDDVIQHKVNLYDAEIRSVDDQLGAFFSHLKTLGLYDDTVIVVVSDHGEQFDEHGEFGHGKTLHIEEMSVPFLIKCNGKNEVVDEVVSNMDVTPSILGCLDLKVPNKFDGISLLDKEKLASRISAYSSVNRSFIQEAITTKEGLRIINSKGRVEQPLKEWEVKGAYNLEQDPFEANPIFESGLVSELKGYLDSARTAMTPANQVEAQSKEVSNDSLEQLESLGYINE